MAAVTRSWLGVPGIISSNKEQKRLKQQQQQHILLLPLELIIQILSRLPIKSLFQCKAVGKSFYALLSQPEPYFARLYSQLSLPSSNHPTVLIQLTDSNVLLVDSENFSLTSSTVSKFSLDFLNDPTATIRASNSGLLCCASFANRGVYYVCNPVTRQFRLLPRVTAVTADRPPSSVGLAFNRSSWKFHVLLAGFFERDLPHDQLVCLLFDSHASSWNRIVISLHEIESRGIYDRSRIHEDFTTQVIYLGSSLCWLPPSHKCVLALDLEGLVSRRIPMPSDLRRGRHFLMEVEGLLSLVQISICGLEMTVWVLKDWVSGNWALESSFSLSQFCSDIVFPISRSKNMVLIASPEDVLTYNWKFNAWRRLYDGDDTWCTHVPFRFYALSFRSTLFPCQ